MTRQSRLIAAALLAAFLPSVHAVPTPKKPTPQLLPGVVQMTWGGVPWHYDFRGDGTCETRGKVDRWSIDAADENTVTVRLSWNERWWICTYDRVTGEGWGAEVLCDEHGEYYRQEVKVKLERWQVMPKGDGK